MSKAKSHNTNQPTLFNFFKSSFAKNTNPLNIEACKLKPQADLRSVIASTNCETATLSTRQLTYKKQASGDLRDDFNLNFIGKMYYPYNEDLFRQYQLDIVKTCLIENTLVCLPTGLGKTFIASVIMYNFHLWFKGKIFFLAPTKPLVNQQKLSFAKQFSGISAEEVTGKQSVKSRMLLYEKGKVFFMTPQTLDNDLKNEIMIKPNEISLVIFDEAHKSQKNYSYVNIAKKLNESNSKLRMIGLTATPGANLDAIQKVIEYLRITAIELRSEKDEEIRKHTFNKRIQIFEIKEEDQQIKLKSILDRLINGRLEVMKRYGICDKKVNVNFLTIVFLLKSQDQFKENKLNFEEEHGKSMVSEIFDNYSLLFSLLHSKKMLTTQGVDSFKKSLMSLENGASKKQVCKLDCYKDSKLHIGERKGCVSSYKRMIAPKTETISSSGPYKNDSKARQILLNSSDYLELKNELLIQNPNVSAKNQYLHPKLKALNEVLTSNMLSLMSDSKAIIFTQFKDSAREIQMCLNDCFPKLGAEVFHGQDKNFKQKDQLDKMSRFKAGDIRVLIATSVAEEGLDIGEVDLIICYDMASSSPIRMIQRFGRTGRKRDGVVIVLATQGEEKNKYFQCLHKLKSVNNELKSFSNGYRNSKIRLVGYQDNLYIPPEYISNIEYFDLKEEIIDNADDFISNLSDNEEDKSINNESTISKLSIREKRYYRNLINESIDPCIRSNNKAGDAKTHEQTEIVLEDFSDKENVSNQNLVQKTCPLAKKTLNFSLLRKPQYSNGALNKVCPKELLNLTNSIPETILNKKQSKLFRLTNSRSAKSRKSKIVIENSNNYASIERPLVINLMEEEESLIAKLFDSTNKKKNNIENPDKVLTTYLKRKRNSNSKNSLLLLSNENHNINLQDSRLIQAFQSTSKKSNKSKIHRAESVPELITISKYLNLN